MNWFLLTLLFLLMTLLGSYGCFALKLSTSNGLSAGNLLRNKYFYLGGGSYFLSALLNIVLLQYIKYAVILPLTSATYIWSMFFAFFCLKEKITKEKIIGMLLLIIGIPFLLIN